MSKNVYQLIDETFPTIISSYLEFTQVYTKDLRGLNGRMEAQTYFHNRLTPKMKNLGIDWECVEADGYHYDVLLNKTIRISIKTHLSVFGYMDTRGRWVGEQKIGLRNYHSLKTKLDPGFDYLLVIQGQDISKGQKAAVAFLSSSSVCKYARYSKHGQFVLGLDPSMFTSGSMLGKEYFRSCRRPILEISNDELCDIHNEVERIRKEAQQKIDALIHPIEESKIL